MTSDLGTITFSQEQAGFGEILRRDLGTLVTLFLLISLLAGVAGWLAAKALSRPFQRLAVAAGALGRGLDLPKTRIPEAQAISEALSESALQPQSRISRERAFAEHASHELRTPLTALRLELEGLTLRGDVPDDVKEAATRCVTSGVTSPGERKVYRPRPT